jgi:membrane protease YdiL (CAAX protease family)
LKLKEILIYVVGISIVVLLPHTNFFPVFSYSIPVLIVVWLILKSNKESFSDIGFSIKLFKPIAVLYGILIASTFAAFSQLLLFPFLDIFITTPPPDVSLYSFITESIWSYLFIVSMGFLIGGFYEQIVFHGFIFTRFKEIYSGKYSQILSFILTSLLFGIYHYQLGLADLINATIIGMGYLSLVIYFKQNLWYSIICHGTYNTIIMTLIYLGYIG